MCDFNKKQHNHYYLYFVEYTCSQTLSIIFSSHSLVTSVPASYVPPRFSPVNINNYNSLSRLKNKICCLLIERFPATITYFIREMITHIYCGDLRSWSLPSMREAFICISNENHRLVVGRFYTSLTSLLLFF